MVGSLELLRLNIIGGIRIVSLKNIGGTAC